MLTTQYFGMKIQRYMHDHGISRETLLRVAEKAFRNGSLTPTAWRQTALSWEEIDNAPMVSEPLNKYMFCSPAEGGCALIVCRADIAHEFHPRPIYLKTAVVRSRNYGSLRSSVQLSRQRSLPHLRLPLRRRRSNWQEWGQRISMSLSFRTPKWVRKSCTWPKTASATMASRNNGWPTG